MKKQYGWLVWLVLLMFTFNTQVSAETVSPKARVQETVDAVLQVLRDSAKSADAKKIEIREIIGKRFDFRAMSQSTLARNWKSASPQEQTRFVQLYTKLLEDTYLVMVEEYTNETVDYRNETIRKEKYGQVDTAILASDKEIPVIYKTRLKDGDWYIYDVVIEGVSLISNYRSSYQEIAKREGMSGLLAKLEEKTGCTGDC